MADIINELASRCGISPEQAQKGLGALLSFFEKQLPAETFAKLKAAVPAADNVMQAAAQTGQETAGGVIGAVTGMVGKIFGSSSGELISKLSQYGFSAEQLQAFFQKVVEFFRSRLPAETMKEVSATLPEPAETGVKDF